MLVARHEALRRLSEQYNRKYKELYLEEKSKAIANHEVNWSPRARSRALKNLRLLYLNAYKKYYRAAINEGHPASDYTARKMREGYNQ